jgi:methylmalonyl-CoA/ethylmalonyl-CoA epimerase
MHIDHAGIATDDAAGLADLYVDLFGCEHVHSEEFDGMDVHFLDCGNGYLELLEPLDDEGAIASYLDRNGPGIQHLAFATDDAAAALDPAAVPRRWPRRRGRPPGRAPPPRPP